MAGIFKFFTRRKTTSAIIVAAGGALTFAAFHLYNGNRKFYRVVAIPAVHQFLQPEKAHRLTLLCTKWGLLGCRNYKSPVLKTQVWGLEFENPIGLAAGFDKDGEAVTGLLCLGFGFIEVGSVTPQPQPGNPKPRIFRLVEDKGVINRCGFNSQGHEAVLSRLELFNERRPKNAVVGISLGKNKMSTFEDYVDGVATFGSVADYLVINVSSPNTPGLRELHYHGALKTLVEKVLTERSKLTGKKPPILIKISPDVTEEDKKEIAKVVTKRHIDGLIVSNTTVDRPATLKSSLATEEGGLSGKPLASLATATVRDMYRLTNGKIPIIGVGGVSSGHDAYEKIKAGASLVQLYTALVYEGPPVVETIKKELEELLKEDGYKTVAEAVGANHRKSRDKASLSMKIF